MLIVRVFVNNALISEATARNTTNLSTLSDYECTAVEFEGPFQKGREGRFSILCHNREQSCWALVEKMAFKFRMDGIIAEASEVSDDRSQADATEVAR